MNFKLIIPVFALFYLCLHSLAMAQFTYQLGGMPVVNLNKGFNKGWSLNFKWESRFQLASGEELEGTLFDPQYVLSEFSLATTKKVGLHNRIAAGYDLRLRNGDIFHELIQQFTIVKVYNRFRMAHRFAANQLFADGLLPIFRFRYRVTAEFPLNGTAIDPKEFYFKLNNEYLGIITGKDFEAEIRLVPLFGYVFTDNNKLEFGIDYRLSSFIGEVALNSFWININWYLKL